MTTRWKTTCALAALAGCGAEPGGGDATGRAVAAIEAVPAGVQCIRLSMRGATRSFDVAGGAAASLALGPQPAGTMSVTGAAYDVACAAVTPMTQATWVSDAASVTIVAGLTADFVLTMRPNSNVNGRVDFVLPARAIAAGGSSSDAVMADGTVRAWGDNSDGQLGDGTSGNTRRTPVAVSTLSGAREVVAGARHACAGTASSQVFCWGYNLVGELGDGTTTSRLTPVALAAGAPAFAQIAAGADHTCGITDEADPAMYCWGANNSGQLATGDSMWRVAPTRTRASQFAAVFTGYVNVTCVAANVGSFECWGFNHGSLGNGGADDGRGYGPHVMGYVTARTIAIGGAHTCALTYTGVVMCAGENSDGQIGDGTFSTNRLTPTEVSGLTDVTQIAAGQFHTCARRRDGTVWCWGGGYQGQLGDGLRHASPTPRQVEGLSGVSELAGGQTHTCALRTDGTVWCWGYNVYGQLGDGSARTTPVPVRVRL